MLRVGITNPIDRIQRGGGSVKVSAAGAITATPKSGQSMTVQGSDSASVPALIVKLGASATGNAQEWRASDNSVKFRVSSGGNPRVPNNFAYQALRGDGTTATDIMYIDTSNIVIVGNSALRTNIRTSEGAFTSTADGPINGNVTLTLNGTTYKLATVA